ncbi:hypothetical protein FACS1894219_09640 [Clostridia bacterium]|nr:hypothetical protein FACS1894219_09640 [Clostridia bacterium]
MPACNEEATQFTEETTTSSVTDSPAPLSPPEPVARYTADGKRIITVGTWYERYYSSKHTDIYADPGMTNEVSAQIRLENIRKIEEKYNIVLNFVNLTFNGLLESMNTSIAEGQPDVDIYEAELGYAVMAAVSGYAVSLEEMGLEDTDVFGDQVAMSRMELMGQDKNYLFTPSNSGAINAYPLAFNLDMITEAGLENPQDVYDRGEWTWEVFREYLTALTQDTNGDGQTDIYGYGGFWTNMLTNLLFSNGTGIAAGREETLSSPATLEVLEFIGALYNEDKTARPWDANWDINNNLYTEGLNAFFIGADWIFKNDNAADLPFEIGVVPWPCGPSGNFETNKHSQPAKNWFFIPKNVADPRFVYDVFYDWVNWFDGDSSMGEDLGWARSMYMTDRNFAYAQMMDSRPGFDMWESVNVSNQFSITSLLAGIQLPEEVVEQYTPVFKTALDNFFK